MVAASSSAIVRRGASRRRAPLRAAAPARLLGRYCVTCHNARLRPAGSSSTRPDGRRRRARRALGENRPQAARRDDAAGRRRGRSTSDTTRRRVPRSGARPRRRARSRNPGTCRLSGGSRAPSTATRSATCSALDDLPTRARLRAAAAGRQREQRLRQHRRSAVRLARRHGALPRGGAEDRAARRRRLRAPVMVNIHQLPEQLPQDERVDELSFGTRGGLGDATAISRSTREYVVDVETAARVARAARDRAQRRRRARRRRDGRTRSRRGRRARGAAASSRVPRCRSRPARTSSASRSSSAPRRSTRARSRPRMRGRGTLPAIAMATIRGPYEATGPGDTPSRAAHLRLPAAASCRGRADRRARATILRTLARRAYRRPVDRRRRRTICCRSTRPGAPKAASTPASSSRSSGCS